MHLLCTEQDDSRGFFLVEQQRLIECLGTRENECRPVVTSKSVCDSVTEIHPLNALCEINATYSISAYRGRTVKNP
ncbi:hypothetical protein NPIL_530321 [Nephila pilipes]|uniref:Uncharacterized protein n=1 Tax=Nephila pilipes TaxID=299642 RepID=A0A8X6MQY3_NEPPI|nr:hypothetical protein NPIL_530321 [Nephila pilipes]